MRKRILFCLLLAAVCLFTGCEIRTADQMYCLPKRPQSYNDLQSVIDEAMTDMEYSAPRAGEHQQTVQMADLDGDGIREYLLFAKKLSDKSLWILIFAQKEDKYLLANTIACTGSSFDRVEYVQMDGKPGLELVVGCQLGGQVPRCVSVYTWNQGQLQQLLMTNYADVLTCDLDEDGGKELMVLSSGTTESGNGAVTLYSMASGNAERSNEATMSVPAENIKRIITGKLHGGKPAVFVGSFVEESAIITDVYTMIDGNLSNISISSESGTSVQTLRNYYVYAVDIDNDGEVEMPALIPMKPLEDAAVTAEQHLIRWYAMGTDGSTADKRFTYHNYMDGWYLELDPAWIHRISVTQQGSTYQFYLWDVQNENAELIFSICVLTGTAREELAQQDNRFILHKTDSVIYAARMEVASGALQITQDDLINGFHMIRMDWNSGEK